MLCSCWIWGIIVLPPIEHQNVKSKNGNKFKIYLNVFYVTDSFIISVNSILENFHIGSSDVDSPTCSTVRPAWGGGLWWVETLPCLYQRAPQGPSAWLPSDLFILFPRMERTVTVVSTKKAIYKKNECIIPVSVRLSKLRGRWRKRPWKSSVVRGKSGGLIRAGRKSTKVWWASLLLVFLFLLCNSSSWKCFSSVGPDKYSDGAWLYLRRRGDVSEAGGRW